MALILVDQDGPLADFEGGFHKLWRERHPDAHHVPVNDRRGFKLFKQYPAEHREDIEAIFLEAGFFEHLPVVPGAAEALAAMRAAGHDAYICTSPMSASRFCASEKYNWIREHLGAEWIDRTVLARDKTMVRGDILIDDRPGVTGLLAPSWTQLIYDTPYNRDTDGPRLARWADWAEVIEPLIP